jgi:hypothetical protein
MTQQIEIPRFTAEFFDLLDETFENHHGIYLDKDTSLFTTLAGINAAEASQPVGGKCASIAAQVAHVTFYLEVLERYIQEKGAGDVDWGKSGALSGKLPPKNGTLSNINSSRLIKGCWQCSKAMLIGEARPSLAEHWLLWSTQLIISVRFDRRSAP